tara:strand:+ start:577 stop:1176 length:600 start_codon:yes stop_codon:yes gene_type:complete
MSLTLGTMWGNTKKNNYNKVIKNNSNRNFINKVSKNRSINVNNKNKLPSRGTKGYWGSPTWLLFHSLAQKVNSEKYKKHYKIFWTFIRDVCNGLPCPYCRSHAVNYLNRIKLSDVNTKEKLINTLFVFHNSVNLRTGKGEESKNILKKYKSSNLNKILELFMSRFFVSYIGTRHFDDWIKNKLKEKVKIFVKFYNNNIL